MPNKALVYSTNVFESQPNMTATRNPLHQQLTKHRKINKHENKGKKLASIIFRATTAKSKWNKTKLTYGTPDGSELRDKDHGQGPSGHLSHPRVLSVLAHQLRPSHLDKIIRQSNKILKLTLKYGEQNHPSNIAHRRSTGKWKICWWCAIKHGVKTTKQLPPNKNVRH